MALTAKMDQPVRIKSYAEQKRLCQRMTRITAWLLVPVVLIRRLVRSVTGGQSANASVSVLAEARIEAGAIVPYIFMG